jgi:uncharacterized membrane protein
MSENNDVPMTDAPRQPQKPFMSDKLVRWIGTVLLLIVVAVWVIFTPDGLLGKANAVGYAVCHRITIRSFLFPDGHQFPLCARCTGTFIGVLIGFLGPGLLFRRRHAAMFPPVWIMAILIGFSAIWAFDGLNSYTFLLGPRVPHLYLPSNPLRLITGVGQGITMGSLLLPVLNSILWADAKAERTIQNGWQLLALLGIGGAVVAMILSSLAIFLYPLALLSALGVVAILSAIGTVAAAALLGRENTAKTLRDALPLILWGMVLAFVLIGAIDLARFLLPGTWDGFVSPPV